MPLRLDVNVTVKLDAVHVHFHGDAGHAEVLQAIDNLRKATTSMNAKLQAALDELNAETAENTSKIGSLTDYIRSIPGLIGAAVTQALADANVSDETAAGLIHDAARTASDNVDAALAAVDANTGGSDTVTSGDTLPAGSGNDTVSGGDVLSLTLDTTALPDAVTGQGYTASLEIAGGVAPYNVESSPPSANGVTINSTGGVFGTPEVDGDSTFSVTVTDSADPPNSTSGAVSLHSAS